MSERGPESRFYFLYRTDKGRIDRGEWWRGMAFIVAPLGLLAAGDALLMRALDRAQGAFGASAVPLAAFVADIILGFAVLLGAVCYYNLSAKRFRDRNYPAALAGLAPFAILLALVVRVFRPEIASLDYDYASIACDAVAALASLWSIVALGLMGAPGGAAK